MKKLRWLLAPVAMGFLALAIACGGKDDGATSNNDSGSNSGGGRSVSRELDLSNAATDLMELRSFRFEVALKMDFDMSGMSPGDDEDEFGAAFANAFLALFSNIKMEGAYLAPDSFDISMELAGEKVHMIQIGDEAWINEGSGWKATDPGEDLSFFGNPSDLAFDLLPQEVLKNAKIKSEKVNGIDTTRYSFDKASLEAVARDMGEETAGLEEIDEAKLDVWVTEGNVPVKIVLNMKGKAEDGSDLSIDLDFAIKDLNSDKIKITRPI